MGVSREWFRDAGVGMFIHWGVYSVLGRGEWVMQQEQIPLGDYDRNIEAFRAEKYDPDEWARLAKEAGMRYVVLTTKHHDGFCLFNTATTDRNAVERGPKRDLVKDYAEACRRHGLKVGLYFSWPDWSVQAFNDGPGQAPRAWAEYVEFTHEQVRELCTNYGTIDLLWYDQAPNVNGAQFMTADHLRSVELNAMVRTLQPGILTNDRSLLPGDFYTAEQHIRPPDDEGRLWEACLTMNRHWGHFAADDMYKPPKEIVHTLTAIAMNGGNMLLNVGPKPDGTIGLPERERLAALGKWLSVHREAVTGMSRCQVNGGTYGCSATKGDSVYLYVHWWHGAELTIASCEQEFASSTIVSTGEPVDVRRDGRHVRLPNLPAIAPDPLCTVIRLTA